MDVADGDSRLPFPPPAPEPARLHRRLVTQPDIHHDSPACPTSEALRDGVQGGAQHADANWPGRGASGGGCDPPSGGRPVPLIRARWALQLGPCPVRRIDLDRYGLAGTDGRRACRGQSCPFQPCSTSKVHVRAEQESAPRRGFVAPTWPAGSSAALCMAAPTRPARFLADTLCL